MKVGLLIQNNLWFCPYVKIYTSLFDEWGVNYDLIYWNRDGNHNENTSITYNKPDSHGKLGKLLGYWNYCQFLKNTIKEHDYDRLIVFSHQIGIFMADFLKQKYHGRYIFDYRDLSIEQYIFLKKSFIRLLGNSYANVISSPGFKRCLPKHFNYYISHNFISKNVIRALSHKPINIPDKPITVLTIGGIRIDANPQIIEALGNKADIKLEFVGRGFGSDTLKDIVNKKGFRNISFEGYYDKTDEPGIIEKSSFLNIYYPNWLSHETAMSNRFYNSLIYRRPMIVTKGQIQGDYCEQYNLGLAIDDTENLDSKLKVWLENTNLEEYQDNCIRLLNVFLEDDKQFKSMLHRFVKCSDLTKAYN